jgi:hypothetical protein
MRASRHGRARKPFAYSCSYPRSEAQGSTPMRCAQRADDCCPHAHGCQRERYQDQDLHLQMQSRHAPLVGGWRRWTRRWPAARATPGCSLRRRAGQSQPFGHRLVRTRPMKAVRGDGRRRPSPRQPQLAMVARAGREGRRRRRWWWRRRRACSWCVRAHDQRETGHTRKDPSLTFGQPVVRIGSGWSGCEKA